MRLPYPSDCVKRLLSGTSPPWEFDASSEGVSLGSGSASLPHSNSILQPRVPAISGPFLSHWFQTVSSGRYHPNPVIQAVFTVPKPQGGKRLIIDLSSLNLHIPCPSFKMLDANKIRHTIPKQAFFTSLDISDAFHHILIHPRFQKYVVFSIQGRLFFFQSMPFGLNLGPPTFTTVITPALKMLHYLGISASVYIDDWLLWARDPRLLLSQTLKASKLLSSLGFLINHKKSQFSQTSVITYLGVLWYGTIHRIRPADRYIHKTSTFVIRFLQKRSCHWRDYQRLLRLLNFAVPLCKKGRLHLRLIIQDAPRFPKFHLRQCQNHPLPAGASPVVDEDGQPSAVSAPLASNSNPDGLDRRFRFWVGGASFLNHEAWGVWSQPEVSWHINAK